MTENNPLVTILAISYNQERYVIETLNSIIKQTYLNIQLIIADDGSTDGTKQLITSWITENRPGTIFLNHLKNKGVTKNLNSALPYIQGKYYQFVGCEDIMLPDKIEAQVKLLEENPQVAVVYSDMQQMDADGVFFDKTFYNYEHRKNNAVSGMVYEQMLERCFISTPTVLIRSEMLFSLGGDNEKLEVNDFDFWMRASKKYLFLYHPDITMLYRVLSTSIGARSNLFHYKNGFLVYYFNYDKRKKYNRIYSNKMLSSVRMLRSLKYKKTALFSFKAFLRSGRIKFLYYGLDTLPLLFSGKEN